MLSGFINEMRATCGRLFEGGYLTLRTREQTVTTPENIEVGTVFADAALEGQDVVLRTGDSYRAAVAQFLSGGKGKRLLSQGQSMKEHEIIFDRFDRVSLVAQGEVLFRMRDNCPVFCTSIRRGNESLTEFFSDYVRQAIRSTTLSLPGYWRKNGLKQFHALVDAAQMIPSYDGQDEAGTDERPTAMCVKFDGPTAVLMPHDITRDKEDFEHRTGLVIQEIDAVHTMQFPLRFFTG